MNGSFKQETMTSESISSGNATASKQCADGKESSSWVWWVVVVIIIIIILALIFWWCNSGKRNKKNCGNRDNDEDNRSEGDKN